MKTIEDHDTVAFNKRFPTRAARIVADKAVDKLSARESMAKHVDVWLKAYREAGGKEPRHKD